MKKFTIIVSFLLCLQSEGGRSLIVAPSNWSSAIGTTGMPSTADIRKIFRVSFLNMSPAPQQIRVTGLFRGGDFYRHPSMTSYKTQILFGLYDETSAWVNPNEAVSGFGSATQPNSGYRTLGAHGEPNDAAGFSWGVIYNGPTASGSLGFSGVLSFKIEVVEDRGALTGSVSMTQVVGDRTGGGTGLAADTISSINSQVVNYQLNGGRPF